MAIKSVEQIARMRPLRAADVNAPPEVEGVPISVRFPPELREATERYAEQRRVKLATAIRMIVSDFLEDEARDGVLASSLAWQREAAWATMQTVVDGTAREVSWGSLRETHTAAVKRAARPARKPKSKRKR